MKGDIMAILSREDLINRLSEIIGERSDDTVLSYVEDLTDTLSDYESRLSDSTDWKAEAERIDNEWREKYIARFFNTDVGKEENIEIITVRNYDYNELFKGD